MSCRLCHSPAPLREGRFAFLRVCADCGGIGSAATGNLEQLQLDRFDAPAPPRSPLVRLFEHMGHRRTHARLVGADLRSGKVLEIGVGSGSLLSFLRGRGYEVEGCDLCPHVCEQVQQSYGIPVHCGDLPPGEEPAVYDAIILNHVLEHTERPAEFLARWGRRLKPGGILHIAVPNADCLEALLPSWIAYEPYHLVYFTPRTLKRLVQTCGYAVRRLETHESFSGWALCLLRWVLGVRSPDCAARRDRLRRRPWLVDLAYSVLLLAAGVASLPLRRLQEYLGRGDELVAVAGRVGG